MRQGVFLFIYFYAVLLTLVGCSDGKSVRQLPHLGNTPYQQDTILVTYATNPNRALTLLDSALLLGNVSEYRGQCIRARIYSKSLVEQRQDSAILICKDLLSHDSVRNNPTEQQNILDLLIATLPSAVPSPTTSNTCIGPHRRPNSVRNKAKRPNVGEARQTLVL